VADFARPAALQAGTRLSDASYDQMPQPKWGDLVGACASTGGIFDTMRWCRAIDTIPSVDVYVPGCRPARKRLLYGVLLLHKKIKGESLVDRVHGREEQPLDSARPATPPRADRRSRSRSATPSTSPLGVNPPVEALRATSQGAIGRGASSRTATPIVYIARRSPARRDDVARVHPQQGTTYLVDVTSGSSIATAATARGGSTSALARAPRRPAPSKWSSDPARGPGPGSRRAAVAGPPIAGTGDYDMFGRHFRGHPDLRRILIVGDLRRSYPRRKDFPLPRPLQPRRQVRQALGANPEAHYSMEELSDPSVRRAPRRT